MKHMLCWLWLMTRLGGSTAKIYALIKAFGSVENIYYSRSFENIRGLGERERLRLIDKDLTAAKKIVAKMAKLGGKIIAVDGGNYPEILKQIHNPPPVIYVKGNMPRFDEVLTIAVVGTREASDYGLTVTKRLSASLAGAGVVTVSGMAMGADAAGAWETINQGGTAVGVVASGLDIEYPPENAGLYKEIIKNGCVITEFPPGTAPIPRHFPMRNRIIAGLSRGVLVTEAPERSGALITARFAIEEGRDVFAVPGNITDINISGSNKLIQQGAKLVMSAEDIICEYPYAGKSEPAAVISQKKSEPKDTFSNLAEGDRHIAALLAKGDMQIDELVRETGMSVGEINTRLTMLEINGKVTKLPGGMYRIKL